MDWSFYNYNICVVVFAEIGGGGELQWQQTKDLLILDNI
jgi:hypothetical protein